MMVKIGRSPIEAEKQLRKSSIERLPMNTLIQIIEKLCFDDALSMTTAINLRSKEEISLKYHQFSLGEGLYRSSPKTYSTSQAYEFCKSQKYPRYYAALVKNKTFQGAVTGYDFVSVTMLSENATLIKALLKDPKFDQDEKDTSHNIYSQILWRILEEDLFMDILDFLLRGEKYMKLNSSVANLAITAAASRGFLKAIKRLLSGSIPDPFIGQSNPLSEAAYSGQFEAFILLWDDPRISSADYQMAFRVSCGKGHTSLVKMLLSVPAINPNMGPAYQQSDEYQEPLLKASERGHAEVVRLLLDDSRVDPSIQDNAAIKLAIEKGRLEIVEMLLLDGRIIPKDPDPQIVFITELLYKNCRSGYPETLKTILSHFDLNPSIDDNSAIILAAAHGRTAVVDFLLADPRVRPDAQENEAIILACKNGQYETVKRLLQDQRVNPSDRNNLAMFNAASGGFIDVVKLLFADPKLDSTLRSNQRACMDIRKGRMDELINRFLSRHKH